MQLSNLPTATIASLKSFARANNLLPTGDLRLKATWLEAVTAFLIPAIEKTTEVIAIATSPEAVATYKASAIVAAKFVYRAFIVSCLLAIALGMSAADTWHQFKEWLEGQDLTPSQPVAIVRLVASKVRKRVNRFAVHGWDRLQDWIETQTVRAWYAVDENAIQPAAEFRDRINAARLVITR